MLMLLGTCGLAPAAGSCHKFTCSANFKVTSYKSKCTVLAPPPFGCVCILRLGHFIMPCTSCFRYTHECVVWRVAVSLLSVLSVRGATLTFKRLPASPSTNIHPSAHRAPSSSSTAVHATPPDVARPPCNHLRLASIPALRGTQRPSGRRRG